MIDNEQVIQQIHDVFGENPYPGNDTLQGSFEGSEPYEEVGAFVGIEDWHTLEAPFLDAHYAAMNFFSEEGFRFYLPAYLVADLREQLQTADPVFHLAGGFHTIAIEVPTPSRVFVRRAGGSVLMNPRRYGAMTHEDYARFRLSIFPREEAQAIVAYLNYRREHDEHNIHTPQIDGALQSFWLERTAHAPTKASLMEHTQEEKAFLDHLTGQDEI